VLTALVGTGRTPAPRHPDAEDSRDAAEARPDPSLARELGRWPNAGDLARLKSVEGKRAGVVLRVLGHPSRVERRPGGEEVWDYPWCATCRVRLRGGVCTGTFYTGGY
jgi:hypothetical protein